MSDLATALDSSASDAPLQSITVERSPEGGAILRVANRWATAEISLHGGQVLRWQPRDQPAPVLWMSELAVFRQGKAIRGGVPICWPWFGPHGSDPSLPAHGYARLLSWDIDEWTALADGATRLHLRLPAPHPRPPGWVESLALTTTIVVGKTLEIALETTNVGTTDVSFTEGFHTYLEVGAIDEVEVHGLEGARYVDLLDDHSRRTQAGPIAVDAELGRIYIDTDATCTVDDRRLRRRLIVDKSGSRSTAVWNPWLATASAMADLGPTQWREMICVETANALDNAVTLTPGSQHRMTAVYTARTDAGTVEGPHS